MTTSTALLLADLTGVAVFAASGASAAVAKRLDLFGVASSASSPPSAVGSSGTWSSTRCRRWPSPTGGTPATAAITALAVFWLHPQLARLRTHRAGAGRGRAGLFTVTGTLKALDAGVPAVGACLIGMLTAIGGGLGRDLLTAEIPVVLRREIYALAALAGAVAVVAAGRHRAGRARDRSPPPRVLVFGLRLIALRRRWSAPVASCARRVPTGRIHAPTGSGETPGPPFGRVPDCDQRGVAWARRPALVMLSRPSRQLLRGGVFMGGGSRGPRPGSAIVRSERSYAWQPGRRCSRRSRRCGPGSARPWWSTCAAVPRTSWRSPRRAPARPPSPCGSPPSCSADGTVEAVTVVAPTEHLKTQWADAAARVGIQLDAAFRNADLHSVGRLPRRGRHLRPGRDGPAGAPAAHHDPPHPGDPRRDPPRRRLPLLGRRGEGRLRARRTPADAHRDAVPLRRQPDPVRQLRARRRRAAALPRRLRLRLRRRAARRAWSGR